MLLSLHVLDATPYVGYPGLVPETDNQMTERSLHELRGSVGLCYVNIVLIGSK